VRILAYGVAGWLVLAGAYGIVRSRNLIHTAVCLSVAQSGTYVLLLAIGYQWNAPAPIFGSSTPTTTPVVDPVVQSLTFTDIVVSATVTALLLALTIQVHKTQRTLDPDELQSLRG
jgi:multicomponent Na+:H+ antiporter subunit C